MALQDELRRSGDWLFRWRSYLPLLLVLVLALGVLPFPSWERPELREAWRHACLAISLIGLAIRIHVSGHAPRGTSGRNTKRQKAVSLNTTGMYSVVRHPLYLGNFFVWLGIVSLSGQWSVVLIFSLLFCLYYERIMLAEEAYLSYRFGASYEAWAAATPAFVPRPASWRRPAVAFSMRRAVRREYHALFGILIAFAGERLGEHLLFERRFQLEPEWQVVGLVGLVSFMLLRFLKRNTSLLWVEVR